MTFLRRVLGLDRPIRRELPVEPTAPLPRAAVGETASVRRIAAQLGSYPPAEARFLAALAYLLSRAANAALAVSDVEAREMSRLVAEAGGMAVDGAELVVGSARSPAGAPRRGAPAGGPPPATDGLLLAGDPSRGGALTLTRSDRPPPRS